LRLKLIFISLLLLCLLGVGCSSAQDFDSQLNSIVAPYRFNWAMWELRSICYEIGQWFTGDYVEPEEQPATVLEYFALGEQIRSLEWEIAAVSAGDEEGDLAALEAELESLQEQRAALTSIVERIIASQIIEVLAEQGIFHPAHQYIGLDFNFPPLNFRLGELPYLLVISPRDSIESIREIALRPDLTLEEIESIEAQVEELGVSAIVVRLGGAGALYPTLVTDSASLQFTISAAVEEWLHQYLAFQPLGFLYTLDLLGIARNYEIAIMNETLASMVSDEIAVLVLERYYPEYLINEQPEESSGFDFYQEMREIRITVDQYLAQGQIEQAEEYMEERRQYLISMGYYIRKLNQAYFAFYGTYADSPTSVSPIGAELMELREQSASLREFLETVAGMSSPQDLSDALR
jgi:hypothetical protein